MHISNLTKQRAIASKLISFDLCDVFVHAEKNPYDDRINGDCVLVQTVGKDAVVLAVADGAGGTSLGYEASRIAIESVRGKLKGLRKSSVDYLTHVVIEGFDSANERILGLGTGAVTTLSVTILNGNSFRTVHCGDSTILVMGQRGKLKFQSTSHSVAGLAQVAGVQEQSIEDGHLLVNAVGVPTMKLEVSSRSRLDELDSLFLFSDGIGDNLISGSSDLERLSHGDLLSSCTAFIDEVKDRMQTEKPDDLSLIALRMNL